MTDIKVAPAKATLELSVDELVILVNALNEVCNGLEVAEFSTRIGGRREAAERLLEELRKIAKRLVEQ